MTKLEHYRIKEIRKNSKLENRVHQLFMTSISEEVNIFSFRKLFAKYDVMDLYIMKKNRKDIGIAYFMSCKHPQNKKDMYVRLGLGIIEEERGSSNFPKGLILRIMIKAKLSNMFRNVFMVGITMNPIVYSATCKYWKYTYPSPVLDTSKHISQVKDRIVNLFGMNEIEENVIGVPFNITEVAEVKKKFSNSISENMYINYFTNKISNKEYNKGLLSIVPIDFKNLAIVMVRKNKIDIERFITKTIEEKIKPILQDYRPAN
ncbi:hypothetical protein [Aquimarina sp. AU474]|uniref:hypothetical protein n=1 Tax=Aquimarina sp. AU474 TaxID=2108529 RepID=UPI000D68A6A3|nr:hypothetical protein [Aquimarina sp. AU474]